MLRFAAPLALSILLAAPAAPGPERDSAWAGALPPGEVALPAGFYRGPWKLGPGVRLLASPGAILEGGDPVLTLSDGDRVEHLTVRAEPGAIGILAQGASGLELADVEISGGLRGARIQGGSVTWRGGVVERQRGYGIWLQGCRASLEQLIVRHQEGPAIFSGHVELTLRESALADAEYGLLTEGGRLTLSHLEMERIARAGIALVHADAQISESRLEGPFGESALSINNAQALEIRGLRIRRTGSAGIKLIGCRAKLSGNTIEGARSDAQGIEGDGIFSYNSELESDGDVLLDDGGTAIAVFGGHAHVSRCRIEKAGQAAATVAATGELRLSGCAIGEGSHARQVERGSKLLEDSP